MTPAEALALLRTATDRLTGTKWHRQGHNGIWSGLFPVAAVSHRRRAYPAVKAEVSALCGIRNVLPELLDVVEAAAGLNAACDKDETFRKAMLNQLADAVEREVPPGGGGRGGGGAGPSVVSRS
jgi:hypothetical protein